MAEITAGASSLEEIQRFEAMSDNRRYAKVRAKLEVSCVRRQMLGGFLRTRGSWAFPPIRRSSSGVVGVLPSWANVSGVPAVPGGSAHPAWAHP